jgi:nucleotide-binding universal stress UspA family protein
VCSRARWADLIIPSLNYPPRPQVLARLSSGFRELIQRCPRPLLAVPEVAPLSRALLAYDGSPKAEEALYVATYVAGQWQVPLVVVTMLSNGSVTEETQARAREYLEGHGIQATYVLEQGHAAEGILHAAEAHQSDFLIIGGYGTNPVLEVVLGSVVDQVLRSFHKPILICR